MFRNAPAALFITSDWPMNALASWIQKTWQLLLEWEGALYNGYLLQGLQMQMRQNSAVEDNKKRVYIRIS